MPGVYLGVGSNIERERYITAGLDALDALPEGRAMQVVATLGRRRRGSRLTAWFLGSLSALIGFAGPRVIEQTVREKLPEGFQRAEFLLEKGAIDMIVDRRDMRDRLSNVLGILTHRSAVA